MLCDNASSQYKVNKKSQTAYRRLGIFCSIATQQFFLTTPCPPRRRWPDVRCRCPERPRPCHRAIRAPQSRFATTSCRLYVQGRAPHRARPASPDPSTPCHTRHAHRLCDCTPKAPEMALTRARRPQRGRSPSTKIRT